MPLCTLYLIHLLPECSPTAFFNVLDECPIFSARPLRWIIRPNSDVDSLDLISFPWSLLVIFQGNYKLKPATTSQIEASYHLLVGIPKAVLESFQSENGRLLYPREKDVPALRGAGRYQNIAGDSQKLELDEGLARWVEVFSGNTAGGGGAISMLNLLAFRPGQNMLESYRAYGKAFSDFAGSSKGGIAKLVGTVVRDMDRPGHWDEVAVAHYPSVSHFAEMLASEEYQQVNHRWRLPALKDTCILATSELRLDNTKYNADTLGQQVIHREKL